MRSIASKNEKRAAIGYGPKPAAKFNPGQTRIPAGRPGGGRWGNGPSGGGGSTGSDFGSGDGGAADGSVDGSSTGIDLGAADDTAAPQPNPSEWPTSDNPDIIQVADKPPRSQYNVDLAEEQARGGHPDKHIGKTDQELIDFVRGDVYYRMDKTYFRNKESSFSSPESANDFVNRLLESDKDSVDKVASGELPNKWIEKRFGYLTGTQAYRPTIDVDPYIRAAYNAGVFIVHDPRSPRGYTVLTAYPTNEDPK